MEADVRPEAARAAATMLAGTVMAVSGAVGCVRSVGPLPLLIETGEVSREDFVIVPIQEYGRLHSSDMVPMKPMIVASGRELSIPRFTAGPTFTTLLVSVYHPEFVYTFTGDSQSGGPITLLPVQPQTWDEYRAEHGNIPLRVVHAHLERLLLDYVPVFPEGEERARLRRYLPGLEELVGRAEWTRGDAGARWPAETDGRTALGDLLRQIGEAIG